MKITRLQAENFKKLRAIEIVPGEGAIVDIRGRNAQGKSSVLDAIQAALGGRSVMPAKPVRSGEEQGAIRLELDDGALIIRRTFTPDGGGQIVVENAEGFRPGSPQKMLDGLYAAVAFDPLAFTREKPDEQYRILRGLVTLSVDPAALERANKDDYDTRRDVNRDLKTAEATLEQMPIYEVVASEPLDEASFEAKIASASEHNGLIESRRMRREQVEERKNETVLRIEGLESELASAKDLLRALTEQLVNAEPLPEPINVSEVQRTLAEVRETNRKIAAMKVRVAQDLRVKALRKQADDLTAQMDARTKEIADAFAAAKMPVPGLSFADGVVLFNGEPFDQASSAEKLRVSTAIGMAGNPKLRVMLVRDGSLLDEEGEKLLAEMAAQHDFQLWVEAVDSSGKVGIVMEDGAVKDAPAPAPIETGRRSKKEAEVDPDIQREDRDERRRLAAEAPAESLFGD